MNINIANSSTDSLGGSDDKGFTLVEILIAIVLVGILSVVVIVGISNLTDSGSKSACNASLDAAKAGSVTYFATKGNYAADFTDLAPLDGSGALVLPEGAVIVDDGLAVEPGDKDPAWTLTMTVPATGAPTFKCTTT